MTTKEIIECLEWVSFEYPRLTADVFSAGDVARGKQALTAAIQAVTALEEIKRGNKNDCNFCKHYAVKTTCFPCCACTIVNGHWGGTNQWEFRWLLGEEAKQ